MRESIAYIGGEGVREGRRDTYNASQILGSLFLNREMRESQKEGEKLAMLARYEGVSCSPKI
jgi:hypothetical protein